MDATGEDEVDGAGEILEEEGTFIPTLLTCIIITISTYAYHTTS